MLRFHPLADAKAAEAYYSKADGGYYMGDPNLHREWGGKAAELLGLSGKPDYEHFKRLIHGLDPHTGEQLTAKLVDNRIPGWDVTASVPKGVTVALERGDHRIQQVIWDAARETMAELESMATTRVRAGGKQDDRTTGNLVWYAVEHPETRPTKSDNYPDPDRHIHFVVLNVTYDDAEKQWKAVKFQPIMDERKWFDRRFDSRLAGKLTDLGYQVETKYKADERGGRKYFSWDIEGIPQSVVTKFSRRSQEVEDLAKELGVESALGKDKLGATSRQFKRKDMTLEDYREYWDSRLTDKEKREVAQAIKDAVLGKNPRPEPGAGKAAAFSMEHHFERQAVVPLKQIEITGMERSMGSALPEEVTAAALAQGLLVRNGEATTKEVLEQEGRIIQFAREGKGTMRPLGGVTGHGDPVNFGGARSNDATKRDIATLSPEQQGISLTVEQRAAIKSLVQSRDALNIVDAGQGTGKTTMLVQFGRVLSDHGARVTWLGTTHTAVDELEKRGLPARTLASFLHSPKAKEAAKGSRIILDEASMLSHQDNYDLFMYAQANGCRIDLVGDSKQYKTPAAGDPLKLLTEHAGIKPITMKETMRQSGRLKEAMELIREDKELRGHDILTELGMVHQVPLDKIPQYAADLYLKWSARGDYVPVISPTHKQADEIAQHIREGLRKRGDIKGEDREVRKLVNLGWSKAQLKDARENGAEGVTLLQFGAYREEKERLAVGDRVRTNMNGATKDKAHRIRNGQQYIIAGFTDENDPILNNGWVVDKNWGGLTQGYVITGQAGQGKTAWRAIVAYGSPSLVATRVDGFYTPVSRVRTEVAVLTDNEPALREAIQRRENKKLATDLIGGRVPMETPERPTWREKALSYVRQMQRAFDRLRERAVEVITPQRDVEYGIG